MQTLQMRDRLVPQLSGNALKILAAVSMTVDHVGFIFFPTVMVLRYIGRIALPIFMFMIAEGCHHTRSRLRYYMTIVALAVLCQGVYTVSQGDWYLCVPVSFSLAIPLVYTLQAGKRALFAGRKGIAALWGLLLAAGVAALYGMNRVLRMDYGFWGCMLPVAASLLRSGDSAPDWLKKLDRNGVHVLAMGAAMVPLALEMGLWQWWSMLSLPLLLIYSGKRGKWKLKYFFYIFYPAHMAILQGLAMLIYQT